MLKLLLNHWQVHREPAPFVLTDDPLYCAHLSTATLQLPEVYSVNRVNPIFEEDEDESGSKYLNHKRTHSENETRSSDDTGYVSGPRKVISNDDDCLFDHHMSSDDSDDLPKAVVVSVDVHRESNPEDIISPSSVRTTSSCTYCTSSLRSSDSSPEPYDSLTASNDSPLSIRNTSVRESMKIRLGSSDSSQQTEVKMPLGSSNNMDAREKLERLLQQGNEPNFRKASVDSQDTADFNDKKPEDMEKTKNALMKSLTRALHHKVPKTDNPVTTRTDSTITKNKKKTAANAIPETGTENISSSKREQLETETADSVTRRDESVSTSSSSAVSRSTANSRKLHRHHKHNAPKPITLHQLLPGHWSYDNIYLPQMANGICYHCLHHHNPTLLPVSETDLFYPTLYHHSRSRHSWAPQTMPMRHQSVKENRSPHSSNECSSSTERRYSPDGSSQETESDSQHKSEKALRRKSAEERRSLRVPKKCKCEECLSSALDGRDELFSQFLNVPHTCPCCYLPHRRVKFASDTDLSKHHEQVDNKEVHHHLTNGDKLVHPKFPINLHRLNGHVKEKSSANIEREEISKPSQLNMSRGQKEPVKMDELYTSYPINFQDWEAHYRRKFLLRRRKRALNMIGMAIGIILVVGVAIAMTFIFLRLKRPT